MIDWIYIGSNGFAQVGDPLYHEKNLAEKAIIFQLLRENKELQVPEEFYGIAGFQWKAQSHDFGTYHDLAIKYNDTYICQLEDSEVEEDNAKHDRFWKWINTIESFDFETPEITEMCENKYYEMFPDCKCKVIQLKKAS
jgi:hypothetical protein